ncbi:hypothetical protein GUJ93_ZPchr0003g17091 [Zizania palustris]|uniref:Uncharacterized protein n=1 Tax=Zizania palustris TaxID=103762 RepID=A0A8J5VXL6_ZIZPA|nr:hypothetical protein GUJ93_ZPchr0003g17091 [Zizania palustris]
MPTASCLRPPLPHSSSAHAPAPAAQRLRVLLPPQLPVGLAGGSWQPRRRLAVVGVAAASASPFDELYARGRPAHGPSKKSILWNLIQDIEPLDLSVIQKDVPPETVDAIKRTISGMLGLLPSDQFCVVVEALWNPFFKLLVSSIMTGYTLRNAEYRLCFERNLELSEDFECQKRDISEYNHHNSNFGRPVTIFRLSEEDMPQDSRQKDEELLRENMGKDLGIPNNGA